MPRNEESVETKLRRIAKKAGGDANFQFSSLFHLMTEELLLGCFEGLRTNAALGIDGVTKEQYAENLRELVDRLHRMAYIPQPVVRVYIPKPGSAKQRPLGIPALEDKLVQAGLVRILRAIYEQDFIEDSYGFRPERNCHDALRALSETVESGQIHHIVEADIHGFFDNVDQDCLMEFLSHRIADKRILRYIKRFLKAGIQEDGAYRASDRGTPQGGVITATTASPTTAKGSTPTIMVYGAFCTNGSIGVGRKGAAVGKSSPNFWRVIHCPPRGFWSTCSSFVKWFQ